MIVLEIQISEVEKIIWNAGCVGIVLGATGAPRHFYGPSVLIMVWSHNKKLPKLVCQGIIKSLTSTYFPIAASIP